MASDPFLVGVFFGLVPAMGTLYLVLHRFEGLFSERRAFFAFFIGIAAGLFGTLMQLFVGGRSGTLPTRVAFVLLYGLANAAIMAAILNSRRYRAKPDTPFYALGLGLGFGAMAVLFNVGEAVTRLTGADLLIETVSVVLVGLYFIGSIFVHACAAVWIGRGAAEGGLVLQITKAASAEGLYQLGFLLLFLPWASALVPLLALAASIALLLHVVENDLRGMLPPEIQRELDIHLRRIGRARMRDATGASGIDPGEAHTGDSRPEADPGPDPAKPRP